MRYYRGALVSEDRSHGEENLYHKIILRQLDAERCIWEAFLRNHTPPHQSPPFLIIRDEMKIAQAYSVADQNHIIYTARLAIGLPPDEFKAVLAHELGHIILKDTFMPRAMVFLKKAGYFFLFCPTLVSSVFIPIILARFIFGKTAISFPDFFYLMLACGVATLFFLHLLSLVAALAASRRAEYDADKFAASIIDPAVLARSLVKIWKINGFVSLPRSASFFHEHPHQPYRLRYLRRWRDEKNERKRKKSKDRAEQ